MCFEFGYTPAGTAGWAQRHRHCVGAVGKEFATLQGYAGTWGERCGDGPIPAPVEVSWEAGWQKEWVESSLNTTEERAEMAIALQRVAFEESGGMCYVKYPRHRCVTLRIE